MSDKKYYYCTVCGNIMDVVHDSGNVPMCCMRDMELLVAGVTDGKVEYHVPICKIHSNKVEIRVGKEPHPMEKHHYIEWIEIVTTSDIQRKYLNPGDEPQAHFRICKGEELLHVYAYCNLHKLWKCILAEDCEDDCCKEYDRYTCD